MASSKQSVRSSARTRLQAGDLFRDKSGNWIFVTVVDYKARKLTFLVSLNWGVGHQLYVMTERWAEFYLRNKDGGWDKVEVEQ